MMILLPAMVSEHCGPVLVCCVGKLTRRLCHCVLRHAVVSANVMQYLCHSVCLHASVNVGGEVVHVFGHMC